MAKKNKKLNRSNSAQPKDTKHIKIFLILIVVFGFLYFSWYAYSTQVSNVKESDLQIIKAPKQTKFKPLDPGGLIVENKDRHIYDHVLGKNSRIKKTKPVSENEAPVDKSNISNLVAKQLKKHINTK